MRPPQLLSIGFGQPQEANLPFLNQVGDSVLAFLKRKAISATFFIPGHTALAFPDLVKMIRDEGHEIGHHGWVHENPAERDKAGQQAVLEKGFDALYRAAGVRPVGYRSPAWDLAPDSLPLLRQNGIIYDSSLMGSDFLAYYLRIADTFGPDEPYQFGERPLTW